MDEERMDNLLAQGPPPMPGRLMWTPDTSSPSARCPVCGQWCDTVYLDLDGLTLGCNQCVVTAYVHDYAVGETEKGWPTW